MSGASDKTTHFGYQTVDAADKVRRVGQVFSSVAGKYDVMNDLMSMGVHRVWKHFTINLAAVAPGESVLDLASGTCDLAGKFARQVGASGRVVASDINAEMLAVGRDRMLDRGIATGIEYVLANAEDLPFDTDSFDCVTMAFGLRNVTDKDAALAEIARVTRPGGRAIVLEFSKPTSESFAKVYDRYSFSVLPKLGKLVANDADSYQYLAESIRMHPDQDTLKGMMETAGLIRCQYYNLTGGIVAVHRGHGQ